MEKVVLAPFELESLVRNQISSFYGSINYWVLCAEDREETKYVRYIEVELKEKFWT